MYTKQDLIQCLKNMGLKPTDAIMVHSSMKAIGEVDGGADTVVDEVMNIPDRLTDEPTKMYIVMPDGSKKEVHMYRHFNRKLGTGSFSEKFDKLEQAFYDLGAAKPVKFGDADCILCDARKIYEVCQKLFSIEKNCVIDREIIPEEWWKANL